MVLTNGLEELALEGASTHPCFWLRGIVPKEWTATTPAPLDMDMWAVGDMRPTTNNSVKYFLDGSGGEFSSDKRLRRCGWSAVCTEVDPGGSPKFPGENQTVARAEPFALVQLLHYIDSDILVMSDCSYVAKGVSGQKWLSASKNGDLWEQVRLQLKLQEERPRCARSEPIAPRSNWLSTT